ncbi:MAG TPA: hypothetical protein VGP79_17860 [Bryobacteraceae bacterium]|nr:hypothetical protein [Bryobacteraceae bacterium]
MELTRREAIGTLAVVTAATPAAGAVPSIDRALIQRHDQTVERYLAQQITDPASPGCGNFPNQFGLYYTGTASGIIDAFTSALLLPASKFHNSGVVMERIRLAIRYLLAAQNAEGNVELVETNFNSPPDTGFVTQVVAATAKNARTYGAPEIFTLLEPFLRKAAPALERGGVHTPNHRWVMSAAMAQLHELFPSPGLVRRIDQWLAEGIDIDADGQFTERSALVYNSITDRALVLLALKLRRPELLEPVRRNLDAMLYLLHPGYEVVSEISRRQDANQRGTMASYWFPLAHLARIDQNGRYATLANHFASQAASISDLLAFPELAQPGPVEQPVPDDYEKRFDSVGLTRIRHGLTSATLLDQRSRAFSLHRGAAVIHAVRFASAFFGKAQFIPGVWRKDGAGYVATQSIEGPYFQPFDPPRKIGTEDWEETRRLRKQSEVCRLTQSATVTETRNGFRLRIRSEGTRGVPVAVEINLREGGILEGCSPAPQVLDGWILDRGEATYRLGGNAVRFGPGVAPHRYTQIRGAEPKLPGPSVYLTGFTPFDHTIGFEWS